MKEIRENPFLFSFDIKEDYVRVREGRPWCFDRSLIVLKEFDEDLMELEEVKLGREVLWIHVLGLPMKLMTK